MRENIPVAQRTRVLIVDDSGAMRAILKKILQVDRALM
jgi:chemotaxis response regulator CheB